MASEAHLSEIQPAPLAVLDADAGNGRLMARYYEELRAIARRVLRCNDQRLAIRPTDLVHEAALRLLASDGVWIRDQTHLLALGGKVMRETLIDEIRRRKAAKRGEQVLTVWDERADAAAVAPFDIEDFDGALDRLALFEPQGARIVELRFYAGLTMEEVARTLAISESSAERRWRVARAWLFKELRAA